MWQWVVVFEGEIVVSEGKDIFAGRVELHFWERARRARELLVHLGEVVEIEMRIACGVNKITRSEVANLRHHLEEKGVRSYVERNAEKGVSTALVELQGEFALCYIKLEERMARW